MIITEKGMHDIAIFAALHRLTHEQILLVVTLILLGDYMDKMQYTKLINQAPEIVFRALCSFMSGKD